MRNTKLPGYPVLKALADVFEMTVEELLAPSAPEPDEEPSDIQTVPLAELLKRIGARPAYGQLAEGITASAGKGSKLPQEYDDSRARKKYRGELPERIQLVEIEGECMRGLLDPGDLALVDTEQTPEIGKVVAAVRFYDEVIVKFLREKDGHQYFESRDKTVRIPLDQYTRILGPVVDVQKSIESLLAALDGGGA